MVIVTTGRIAGDKRDFCANWKAIPSNKYNPENLTIRQYAYPDIEIPDDFWQKHTIYYVDHQNENRLVKAYELEDQWNNMQFLTGSVIGEAGTITEDTLLQYVLNQVAEFDSRLGRLESIFGSYDLDGMVEDIDTIKKTALFKGDTVDIEQAPVQE